MNIAGFFSSFTGSDVVIGVSRLIEHDPTLADEQRFKHRIPFRTSALLKPKGDFAWTPVYTRDISRAGMGFTHSMPIDQGYVTVMFQTPAGERISFEADVVWCHRQPDNTYFSGARFNSVQIFKADE